MDITPSIARRREAWKEEVLNDLPLKDAKESLSLRQWGSRVIVSQRGRRVSVNQTEGEGSSSIRERERRVIVNQREGEKGQRQSDSGGEGSSSMREGEGS